MPLVTPEGRHRLLAICTVAVVFAGGATFIRACKVARTVGQGNTYDRVRTILVRRLNVPFRSVTPETRLDRDLVPEGVNRLELQDALQEEFGLNLPPGTANRFRTVQDAVAAVDAVQGAGTRPR